MKRSKAILENLVPVSEIDASVLLEGGKPGKKEIEAECEDLNENGLACPLVVLERYSPDQKYVLLTRLLEYLAALKLGWPKIKVITIPKVPKEHEEDAIKLIELYWRNEASDYDMAKLASALGQGLFSEVFRLSPGYAYNLIRWWTKSIPEVKSAWEKKHPLINQKELEEMAQMSEEDAQAYWQRRQEGGSREGFHPHRSKKQSSGEKRTIRASTKQLWDLLRMTINAPLDPPVKNLTQAVTKFAMGLRKDVPGIMKSDGEADFENLDENLRK